MRSPLTRMRMFFSDFEELAIQRPTVLDTIEIIRSSGEYDPDGGEFAELVEVVSGALEILIETKVIETEAINELPDFETPVIEALAQSSSSITAVTANTYDYTPPVHYDVIDLVLKSWAIKQRSWPSGSSIAIHENIVRSKLFTDEDREYMYNQARERRSRLITSSLQNKHLVAGLTDGIELIVSEDDASVARIDTDEANTAN